MDSRAAEVRTGTTRPEIRQHQGGRVEVRTVDPKSGVNKLDPRTDIRAGYTYQLNALNAAAQKQHPYGLAGLNVPRQTQPVSLASGVGTTTHAMIHSMTGATSSVSSSAVNAQSKCDKAMKVCRLRQDKR